MRIGRSPILGRRTIGTPPIYPAPSNSETTAWQTAVVSNGGSVSAARLARIDWFIGQMKSAGTWAPTDDIWMLWGENQIQSLVSLKQTRLASVVGTPTFAGNRGWSGMGTTNYLNTGFIPGTHKVSMTGTNMRISVYEETNAGSNNVAAGCNNTSAQIIAIYPRASASGLAVQLNSQSTLAGGDALPNSLGLAVGSRNGTLAADITAYKNGVAVVPAAIGTLGSTLPTVAFYIGTNNANGTPSGARGTRLGFVSVGAALASPAHELTQYNIVQSFATQIGAQV